MDKSNIMIYCGLALEKYGQLNISIVQKYIKTRPEINSYLPAEDIEESLNLLCFAGFIIPVAKTSGSDVFYTRNVKELQRQY